MEHVHHNFPEPTLMAYSVWGAKFKFIHFIVIGNEAEREFRIYSKNPFEKLWKVCVITTTTATTWLKWQNSYQN